jgi:hypothetical protein
LLINALSLMQVLDESPAPEGPPWPPADGIAAERAEALLAYFEGEEPIDPKPNAAERTAYLKYVKERTRWLAAPAKAKGTVPQYKFTSNDGWRLSKAEAAVVAKALEELLEDEDMLSLYFDMLDLSRAASAAVKKQLRDFAAFNRRASKSGGYSAD